MLILGQKACFLGTTIFEIPRPNINKYGRPHKGLHINHETFLKKLPNKLCEIKTFISLDN